MNDSYDDEFELVKGLIIIFIRSWFVDSRL